MANFVCRCSSFAAFAQNKSQFESASFNQAKETVSRLLKVPVYTASEDRLFNSAGELTAYAITQSVTDQEMDTPETARRILLSLRLAFEAPQFITGRNNKTPTAARHLLEQLEHTNYGRQPNVISNARYEIEHNTTTGRHVHSNA